MVDLVFLGDLVKSQPLLPLAPPKFAMLRLLLSGLLVPAPLKLDRLEFLRTFFVGLPGIGIPPTVEPGLSTSLSDPIIAVMPVTLDAVLVRTELASSSKSSSSPDDAPNPRKGTL